jgi:hypothetical protein
MDWREKTWRSALLVALGVALTAAPAAAQEQQTQREHVVRRGDTLWDLARTYLSNPFLWPSIFDANRGLIRDPHWIYPDQRVVIPPVVARQDEAAGVARGLDPAPLVGREAGAVPAPTVVVEAENDVLDLPEPEQPPAPRWPVREAEYRTAPWLSATLGQRTVGRVVRLADPAAANDRLNATLKPYDRLHIGGLRVAPAPGDSLLIVRIGREVQRFGRLVEPLAVIHIDSLAGSVAQATIMRQFGAARVGDVVVAFDPMPALPQTPATETTQVVAGRLLEFVEARAIHGASDYGFIDLGRTHGINVGDELIVSVPPRPATMRQATPTPAEDIGTLRVIRVEDGTATVRVLNVTSTVLSPGLQVRRVRSAS